MLRNRIPPRLSKVYHKNLEFRCFFTENPYLFSTSVPIFWTPCFYSVSVLFPYNGHPAWIWSVQTIPDGSTPNFMGRVYMHEAPWILLSWHYETCLIHLEPNFERYIYIQSVYPRIRLEANRRHFRNEAENGSLITWAQTWIVTFFWKLDAMLHALANVTAWTWNHASIYVRDKKCAEMLCYIISSLFRAEIC